MSKPGRDGQSSLFITFTYDATVQILVPSPPEHLHIFHLVQQSLERGQIIRRIKFSVPMAQANLEDVSPSVQQDLSQMHVLFDLVPVTKQIEQELTVIFIV